MPLDGTTYKPKIKPLQTGLAGMRQLADALRYGIPQKFRWNFAKHLEAEDDQCGSYGCLIGLARTLWPTQVNHITSWGLAEALNLPQKDISPLLGCDGPEGQRRVYGEKCAQDITRHDVADAIDRYIAEKEAA